MGRDIPPFFRLDGTGTGVFIMGFNPRSANWVEAMTNAVVENFFQAVADKQLVVRITSAKMDRPVVINHETIDSLLDRRAMRSGSAAHYYRAVRDAACERTPAISPLGSLLVYVVFQDGAPRRTALVNRKGMLICDSKDLRINPLSPRAKGIWPDFAAVIIPQSEQGDGWLRSMESVSHDSLSTQQLPTEAERGTADKLFKRMRYEIAGIIEDLAEVEAYGEESNLDELTGVLADVGQGTDQTLVATELTPKPQGEPDEWMDVAVNDDLADEETKERKSEDHADQDEEPDQEGSHHVEQDNNAEPVAPERGGSTGHRPARRLRFRDVRVIPISTTEAVVAFDTPDASGELMHLSLAPAGADRDARLTDRLKIIEAHALSGIAGEIGIDDGQITLRPALTGRMSVRVTVDGDIQQTALRVI